MFVRISTLPGHGKNGTHQDQAIGRSRGGLTTKIHACVDALANPIRLILTAGQVGDVTQAAALIEHFEAEPSLPTRATTAIAWFRGSKAGGASDHSPAQQSQDTTCGRLASLQSQKSGGALLQSSQAIPLTDNPLRQTRHTLQRISATRSASIWLM
ncbi:hypothetical protein [Brachymonas sp.]|uniref:hypothetical protein n=1 Tax=Brachymonas sp. TaxID=1936292 RepID=UPI0035B0A40F